MTPYWVLFFLPIIGIFSPVVLARDLRRLAWLAAGLVAAMMIGLRHEIGPDWAAYFEIHQNIEGLDLLPAMDITDPGYAAVNWISAAMGWGIYGVNLICAVVFVAGLAAFCRAQPLPWLAWLIATPYLLIVVTMNYTRQGAALGLVFWGLAYLEQRRAWRFALMVALGATFHQSAALLLPFVLAGRRTHWLVTLGIGLAIFPIVVYFMIPRVEYLWLNYFEVPLESEGARIRIWMTAFPAMVMLALNRRWAQSWPDPGHWRWIAWSAIGCLFLLTVVSSTAADRIALYLSPLQLYVGSRIPLLFKDSAIRAGVATAVCSVYAAVLWVWLTYTEYAWAFVPYKMILL
jgi:hypothetical protein